MRPDIVVGATFPDFELSDHLGRPRRLSALQGPDPMVLVLSRGMFCPKDHRQHRNLAELWPEFRLGYAKLVTITTDGLREANEFRDQVGASWPFLCDPERVVQRELDIAEYTDPDHNPMIPHTFVLAPGLRIHAIYNGYWFWGRPTNDDLLHGGAGWADAAAGAVADTTAAKEEANEAEREGADLTPEAGETGRSRGAPGRG